MGAAASREGIREEVRGACELLGLDPFILANEGKLIAIVGAADAEKVLAAMKAVVRRFRQRPND